MLIAIPARAAVGFVDYSGGKEAVPLAPYLEYLVDEHGRLDIERVFTAEQQARFSPFEAGLPLRLKGTLWLRFTLPPAPPGFEPPFLRLDLGRDTPAGAVLYMPDGNLNAALTTWVPQVPLEKNIFPLQLLGLAQQAQAPVTIYVKIPGAVSLWFAPQLLTVAPVSLTDMPGTSVLDMLAVFWSWLLSPSSSLVYVVLGLFTMWCLARAFRQGGEWRLWTAVFAVLTLLQGMIPMPYAPTGKIPLQALLNVVVPGLCFILLVHVGRHLLHSKERKSKLDTCLVLLSLLGVLLPIVPLVPGMSGLLRAMALWPVLAVLPGLLCLGAVAGRVPGAKRYVFSCLILMLGGLLAWRAAGQIAPHPAMVQAPLWGAAIFVFLVGVVRVRKAGLQAGPEDACEEPVEILRLHDMMDGETMDDLLPPLSQEREVAPAQEGLALASAFEPAAEAVAEAKPAPQTAPLAANVFAAFTQGEADSGQLSMGPATAGEGADAKAGLKLTPKLAAMPVPAKAPLPGAAPAGDSGPEPSGGVLDLAMDSDEPLIELKDIISDREMDMDPAAGQEAFGQEALPGLEREEDHAAAAPVLDDRADLVAAEPRATEPPLDMEEPKAPSVPGPEDLAKVEAAAPEEALSVVPEPGMPAEFTAEPSAAAFAEQSSVSQPRPVSSASAALAGEDGDGAEAAAALPWRRPMGGAKKGIDMVGDLIRHGDQSDPAMAVVKAPLLIGPDLLKGQRAAAQWSDRAQEAVSGDDAPEDVWARVIADEPEPGQAEGSLEGLDLAGPKAPVADTAAPAEKETANVDFRGMVDETAHADALWMGDVGAARAADAATPGNGQAPGNGAADDALQASEVDSWKLSDMAHHGRAAQPAYEPAPVSKDGGPADKDAPAPRRGLDAAENELQASLSALQVLLDSPGHSGQELYQAIREQSRAILDAGQRIVAQARGLPEQEGEAAFDAEELFGAEGENLGEAKEEIFDLQVVLSDAHEAVRREGERRNLALSWFMPPHLPLLYLGDPQQLREVLRQLLESAVTATEKGSVQLSVRRVPDSTDPGHLIFSVTDSGSGPGAARRNPLALKRAWSLAAVHGGGLNVESAPGQGSTVAFTMRLKRPPDDLYTALPGVENGSAMLGLHSRGTEPTSIISRQENYLLVVDEQTTNRQLIAFFLGNLPYRVVEARSLAEGMAIYAQKPTGLVILDAVLDGLVMADAVKALHDVDNSLKLSPVPVVALIQDHDEVTAMLRAGCKGTLRKPLSRKRLRDLIQTLLPKAEGAAGESPEDAQYPPNYAFESEALTLAGKEPLKGSPEDYVSHLEFDLTEDPVEQAPRAGLAWEGPAVVVGGMGGQEPGQEPGQEAGQEPGQEPGSERAAAPGAERGKNIMEGLDFLHFGSSALRTEAENLESGRPDLKPAEKDIAQPEAAQPKEAEAKKLKPVRIELARPAAPKAERPPAPKAPQAPLAPPVPPAETGAATEPEPGIGRNRWLSGILDAAGKMAGAVVPQTQGQDKAEPARGEPVPLDEQSLKAAGPEQLSVIPQAVERLESALWAAKTGLVDENCLAVSQSCLRLADAAADYNLENLDRIARCVDRAAQAKDLEAIHDLLGELETLVERNRKRLLLVLDEHENLNG